MGDTMTRRRKNHSRGKICYLHQRQNGKCIYCGEDVDICEQRGVSWSLEHIVPRAVYKWIERSLPTEEVKECFKLVDSDCNLAVVHYRCNIDRGSVLPTRDYIINNEYINDELKETFLEAIKSLQKYMDVYSAIVQTIHNNQKGKCARCAKILPLSQATLRRRHRHKNRTLRNGMLMCPYCNEVTSKGKYGSVREANPLLQK